MSGKNNSFDWKPDFENVSRYVMGIDPYDCKEKYNSNHLINDEVGQFRTPESKLLEDFSYEDIFKQGVNDVTIFLASEKAKKHVDKFISNEILRIRYLDFYYHTGIMPINHIPKDFNSKNLLDYVHVNHINKLPNEPIN